MSKEGSALVGYKSLNTWRAKAKVGPRIYELEASPRVNAVRVEVDATNLKLPVPCSLQNSKQWVPQMKCLHVTHDRSKVPKDNDVAEGFPDGCGVLHPS